MKSSVKFIMKEKIYNIFTIFDEKDICGELGYVIHEVSGSDEHKFELLKNELLNDFNNSKRFHPTIKLTRSEYNAYDRTGNLSKQIEEFFKFINASTTPLFIRTPIKNGKVFYNASSNMEDYSMENIREQLGVTGDQIDWLVKYTSEAGIDILQLINDDYLKAIKLLFNNGMYVSAMKLLLTCIDSLAYIEYGSERNAFIQWLKEYSELEKILITAEELWELRNGLLHMSNLHSSRVVKNSVRRISFYVKSNEKIFCGISEEEVFYFNFKHLIDIFISAVVSWLSTYNDEREKFLKFIERYDQTISDSRVLYRQV